MVSGTYNFFPGMTLSGGDGLSIAPNTTILSITGNTLTLSSALSGALSSGTSLYADGTNKLVLSGGTFEALSTFSTARSIQFNGLTAGDSQIAVLRGQTLTLDGTLSTSGFNNLNKADYGTLVLIGSVTNTASGTLTVSGGILRMAGTAGFGGFGGHA